jgi:tetratricopeptide (TPR) repeat protein
MKKALNRFHTLITEYPTSNKIAEAAWWAGYIHKEYFYDVAQNVDDNEIAVQYFERAYTWKPNIEYQARFEAATVYDFRLHDREKALALYQDVIDKENFNKSNVDFAHKRIREITKTKYKEITPEPDRVVKSPPPGEPQASPAPQPLAPEPEPAPTEPAPAEDRPIVP